MTSKWPAGIERHFWDQLLHPDLINRKQQTLEVLISSWVKIVHGGDGQRCYSRLESTSSLWGHYGKWSLRDRNKPVSSAAMSRYIKK